MSDPSVPDAPRVGVAVHEDADPLVAFGIVPAAALVAFVPPPAIGIVGKSPVAIAPNDPMPLVAVACRTCVVVVSELPPSTAVVVFGIVTVTAPLEAG